MLSGDGMFAACRRFFIYPNIDAILPNVSEGPKNPGEMSDNKSTLCL
jgi:hypothetical protein